MCVSADKGEEVIAPLTAGAVALTSLGKVTMALVRVLSVPRGLRQNVHLLVMSQTVTVAGAVWTTAFQGASRGVRL